jgi:hypothetical protein
MAGPLIGHVLPGGGLKSTGRFMPPFSRKSRGCSIHIKTKELIVQLHADHARAHRERARVAVDLAGEAGGWCRVPEGGVQADATLPFQSVVCANTTFRLLVQPRTHAPR